MSYEDLISDAAYSLFNAWECESAGDTGTSERKSANAKADKAAKESGRPFRDVWRDVYEMAVRL